MPPSYVQHRVEAALRATRLDALPLAQLALRPAWLASTAWPELVGTCARLVREGKVLAWGASIEPGDPGDPRDPGEPGDPRDPRIPGEASVPGEVRDPDEVRMRGEVRDPDQVRMRGEARDPGEARMPGEARDPGGEPGNEPALALIAEPWLAALSVVYNLCDRRAEPLFAAAAKREPPITILARQPLAGGALAGNLGPGVQLPPRDDRNDLGRGTLERIAVAVAKLSVLVKREPPAVRSCDASRRAAERAPRADHLECNDVAELALRFAIDRAGVALPRLHRRDHLLPGIAAAAAPPLSPEIVARILDDVR